MKTNPKTDRSSTVGGVKHITPNTVGERACVDKVPVEYFRKTQKLRGARYRQVFSKYSRKTIQTKFPKTYYYNDPMETRLFFF